MKDIVKGIKFLVKMVFYACIAEIFARGIQGAIEDGVIEDSIERGKRFYGKITSEENNKPEARTIGFVCEK